MVLGSALAFGTYGVWARMMGGGFGLFSQAWIRSLLILVLLVPIMIATKTSPRVARKDWAALAIFCAFAVCSQVPIYYAFNHAPIGTVQLIFYSTFVITAYLVGKLYLNEKITKVKLLAMLLSFAGLALVFGVSFEQFAVLALILAVINGVASGGEVASSKRLSTTYSSLNLSFWEWFVTLATHLPIALLLHEHQSLPAANRAWLGMILFVVASLVAFWLVIEGFRHVDASIGGLIGLMEIIFGVVFGAIFFHEVLHWSVYIGGVLILVSAMLPDLVNIIKHIRTKTAVEPIRLG